ncbi:MAG: Gldg family protein [Candidatus Marinimicrobia bacterium]|nr:Gldg family protein [Candidatus Neomarinimicrobiota bacterium]MDD5582907.1 Gldg family protein [Candidatus Neomarinimicrobiota bacterium]
MAQKNNKRQFILSIIFLAVILILINLISRSLFFRWDLTRGNVYSLSKSSKSIVRQLDDRMTARVFFSEDLPGEYVNARRYLQDLLEEYRAYSKGNFHFEFVNPDDNEKAKQEANSYQIPPVQLRVLENDKFEIKNVYMGLVLLYRDKKEVLPVIQTTEGLEYDITAAIKKMLAKDLKSIGIIAGKAEGVRTTQLSHFLRQTYNVRNVSLESAIPGNIDLLLMNGVLDSLSLDELYYLDQYLMRGGKLFLSQARQEAYVQEGIAESIASNIFSFLEHYGLTINPDIVIDKLCSQIQIQQRQGIFAFNNIIDYPLILIIREFNQESLITKGLDEVRVFFPHEITTQGDGDNFTPLLWTSKNSGTIAEGYFPYPTPDGNYTLRNGYNIYPLENPQLEKFEKGPMVVSGLRTGSQRSFFADSLDYSQKEGFLDFSDNINLLLITDNRFFDDTRAASFPANMAFILNAADVLTGDAELVEIRTRGLKVRPLKPEVLTSETTRNVWKWVNIIVPPLLVIIFALIKIGQNRKKRRNLEEIYD